MADETTAFVIPLHQIPRKKKDKAAAERARAYRQRKKQKAMAVAAAEPELRQHELSPGTPRRLARLGVEQLYDVHVRVGVVTR